MAWQDVPYTGGNFTAASGAWTVDLADQVSFRWNRISRDSLVVTFIINNTDVSAAMPELRLRIPGGFLAARTATVGHIRYFDNGGTATVGFIRVFAGTEFLRLFKAADANWGLTSSDNTSVSGTTCEFEIQL